MVFQETLQILKPCSRGTKKKQSLRNIRIRSFFIYTNTEIPYIYALETKDSEKYICVFITKCIEGGPCLLFNNFFFILFFN